jgi:hypothetical protein
MLFEVPVKSPILPQSPYRLVTTIVVYQVLHVQFHAGTRHLPSASFNVSALLWRKNSKGMEIPGCLYNDALPYGPLLERRGVIVAR